MWMSICRSPTETHVHCLFEEATRFMSTKLKDSNTQHIELEKKYVWAGGWVNTHYDFSKRMTGVSVAIRKRLVGWLLLPQNNTASWSFTVLAGC